MTKTKLRVSGALVFVAALMMAVAGFAQQDGPRGFGGGGGGGGRHPGGGPGREGMRGGNPLGPLARDLNLTDAQKAQIKVLTDSFETSTKSLHEQLSKADGGGGGPFGELKDGAFDEATVRAAAQARASVHVELEVARARLMSQVYALLTTEQKAKVAELRQRFEQNGGRPARPGGDDTDNR